MGLVKYLGSKEDAQKHFLVVGLVHKPDKIIHTELNKYMHNSYVNGKDRWTKTL